MKVTFWPVFTLLVSGLVDLGGELQLRGGKVDVELAAVTAAAGGYRPASRPLPDIAVDLGHVAVETGDDPGVVQVLPGLFQIGPGGLQVGQDDSEVGFVAGGYQIAMVALIFGRGRLVALPAAL
ncbi:hypothetical protein Tph_c10660 [Thermacetogenium phaeum DSM 12270]|uniref:Uncharacterized protein n=1 Tax=Thermacetogenium phaeum (strain ATCC BAA-254 / DSM 26808 / PB) TaxID=1089553 RepID=K4LEP5_THEPS|nr:hypothetical protein Tph_c10660 [Thermacetogenium phaeum DSM 12270]